MGALKELLAVFTFKVEDAPLKKVDKDITSFAKKVVTAFAASEVIGGIKSFVTETLAAGDAITDTAAALGVSRQALQAWQYAGDQVGVSGEGIATAFKFLQKNAASGSAAFAELSKASGMVVDKGAPTEQLMYQVAGALSKVEDPAKRTKLALELLGKGGSQMNALFANGADGVDAMMKRFKELGGGYTDDMLDKMDAAGDALSDVKLASNSLKGSLMLFLAPAIKSTANWVAKLVAEFKQGDQAGTRLKSALIVLGAAGAAAGLAMLAPYIPFLLTIAAIYLIVQDFLTFLEGGQSVTAVVLDWLFGPGGADKARADLKNLGAEYQAFLKRTEQRQGNKGLGAQLEEGFSEAGERIVQGVVKLGERIVNYFAGIPASVATSLNSIFGPGTAEAIMANLRKALSPEGVVSAAQALGIRIAEAIARGVASAMGKVLTSITDPLGSVVLPSIGGGSSRGGSVGEIGASVLDTFIPGAKAAYNIVGSHASNVDTRTINRRNDTKIIIQGAPDPRGLANQLGPHINTAVNGDGVDAAALDVAEIG